MKNDRLVLHTSTSTHAASSLAEDVRLGLTSSPKYLLPKYFYDELGSVLFDAITLLPEYYPTRKESEILSRCSGEIVDSLEGEIVLIELGSGSANKTNHLIEAILRRQPSLTYIPIEISTTALISSAEKLLERFPGLSIEAYAGDYLEVLGSLKLDPTKSNLVLFLGSSIGNYSEADSITLLQTIRGALTNGDGLLLGADLIKSADILEPAYDDSLGVTAAFNLNVLSRINRELDADFDVREFDHVAIFNPDAGRVEMHLESRKTQTVSLGALGQKIEFAKNERIHTENSYKYKTEQLIQLGGGAGFALKQSWRDSEGFFSSNLFTPDQ
jgi:dimethylhistidine N-methyltransferase